MGKKSKLKKQRKLEQHVPGRAPILPPPAEQSPVARKIIERFSHSGPNLTEKRFIKIMTKSQEFRDEPEFRDLSFDAGKVAEVMGRVFSRHQRDLEKISAEGEAQAQELYDDLRIEAIAELATREFRRDFLARYNRMLTRLLKTSDAEKIEAALLVRPLLEQKELPWGIVGLVTAIFEDARTRADQEYERAETMLSEMAKAAGEEGDVAEILKRLENPEQLAEFTTRLESNPQLKERLEEEADRMATEFEDQLGTGEVALDLFTEDELVRPGRYLSEYVKTHDLDPAAGSKEFAEIFGGFIRQTFDEILTEKRMEELKTRVEETARKWQKQGNPYGGMLELEVSTLEADKPSENRFLYAAFIGQMERARARVRAQK